MDELNFARELLSGRNADELSDEEVLCQSARLLENWMSGEARMERPKLYDHYALPLAALCREALALREEVTALREENRLLSTELSTLKQRDTQEKPSGLETE